MPTVKAKAKRRLNNSTQPEHERLAKQVLLRLVPRVRERLDAIAEAWECSRSEAVSRLVEKETAHERR